MMTPQDIIVEAWDLTKKENALRGWGFTSELLATLLDVKLLIYQVWFAYSYFVLNEPIGFFEVEEVLLHALPFGVFLGIMIFLVVLIILEIFVPKICLGAIIGLAAKSHNKEEVRGGLVLGLYNFFPIFALQEFFILAKLTTVITVCSLILRYMVEGLQIPCILLTLTLYVFSNIALFFTSFAEEEIVIRKTGLIDSLSRSFKLIISHLRHVIFLLALMIIISIRVLINALVLLVIPAIIIGVAFFFALFLSQAISITIATVTGIVLIFFASYFFAYLHVFQQTVWTITYMELQKQKDLDVIEV